MDPKKTGNLISKTRKEKGLTQKDLASRLHVTDKAVSKWERGLSLPDISLLIPISEVLDISIYELLGGNMKDNKVEKEDVDIVIKETIKKGKEDNRINNIIKNIIIGILSVLILAFIVLYLLRFTNIINYFGPYRPEKIKIEDYYQYNLKISNKNLVNETSLPCDDNNKNCIGQLISSLPLGKEVRPFGNDELDTIIYTYNRSEDEYNQMFYDKNYVRKGMIVTSLKMFIIIEELEHLEFNFTDKAYQINKDDVIKFYLEQGYSLNDLTVQENWNNQVIDKLNDKEFRNSFPVIEK